MGRLAFHREDTADRSSATVDCHGVHTRKEIGAAASIIEPM